MTSQNLLEFFPPPKFLDVPFAGVSISDYSVRVMKFQKSGSNLKIEKYSEKILPPGAVSNGQIVNRDELIKVLIELKKELTLDYVRVSLPEEKGYLFTAKVPIVPEKEVRMAVEGKIEENVPVPRGELIYDYEVRENKEKERLYMVVSALPIAVVDTYIEVMDNSGMKMLSLEIESQAIARSLLKANVKKTVLIVHYSQNKAGLYVVVDRTVYFSSTVQIRNSSTDGTDQLSQEIKRLFTYWHALKENVGRDDRKIEEIIMCGEGTTDDIVSYVSTHNQIKVSIGNVWTNVFDTEKEIPQMSLNDSLKYVVSIGLALPSENLI